MKLNPLKDSLFSPLDEDLKKNLLLSGVVPVADQLIGLWELPGKTNTVILIGGRGGMKTFGVSQFIAYQAGVNKKRCVILRDEHSLIKESILSEIHQRFDDIPFATDTEKLTTGIKDRSTGTELVFTKGFKASDNQKKANMKGVSNIDIAVIEEAEDLIDESKFNTFVDSLRKEGCLVIIIMNTPDIGHFLLKNYFDCNIPAPVPDGGDSKEYDGYFDIRPKKVPGFVCIKTGYEDNPYLPKHIIDRYKSYGDPASNLYNPHYYMTAIKGYASTGRKGQVLRKVKEISLAEYMKLPFKEFYGQDFGTAAPAGLVGVKFDKNNVYAREINYLPMSTLSIGKLYCTLNFGPNDKIIADSADKDACDKLSGGWNARELNQDDLFKYPGLTRGFWVEKCVKGEGSIRAGIGVMDGLNIHVCKESTNLWTEIRNYVYDQDKNGNFTNDPKDDYNHLIDPLRYVCVDQRGKKELFGIRSE